MLTIKQGDLRPYIDLWLEQPAGVPIPNLDTATAIIFKAKRNDKAASAPLDITGPAELVDVATAHCVYKPSAGETDANGIYNCEVEITVGGEPFTVPTKGFGQFEITADLDPDPAP